MPKKREVVLWTRLASEQLQLYKGYKSHCSSPPPRYSAELLLLIATIVHHCHHCPPLSGSFEARMCKQC